MAWCKAQKPVVYYCLGLGNNSRLVAMMQDALATARGAPSAREFKDLEYQTRQSWSRSRRVVGKAEVMAGGDNPRFIVTCGGRAFGAKTGSASVRRGCMRSFTVPEGTWRTNSSNRCWICRPTG
jgi:hypothetical protein